MRRLDIVNNALKILDKGNGVTATEVSNFLKLERANVSKDLNLLVKEGILHKTKSRPVRFMKKSSILSAKTPLDQLAYLYPSLGPAIKLAKTAILYPPNGINCLIIGDTGVGKSMLAKLMHDYSTALYKDRDIPFMHFNCSDYSNNPQLLSSHLFGVKKGTFTGAYEDQTGLIEQADGGILFLDEIHNLPSEGQEMLFVFMDTGYFKKFGEVKKQSKASTRIICATNKNINTSLLDTFIRRIPIKIEIPGLEDRLIEERLTLIEYFLKAESIQLDKPIHISYNSMLCFLSYPCPYNVGQLKNDIQLAVANAYADYFINNKIHIRINSPDLPKHIKDALHADLTDEHALLKVLNWTNGYLVYDKDSQIISHSYLKQKYDILNCFQELIKQVSCLSLDTSFINAISKPMDHYIQSIQRNRANYRYSLELSAFEEFILDVSPAFKAYLNNDIYKTFFHVHLDMIYERINFIDIHLDSIFNTLSTKYDKQYLLASEIAATVEKTYNINLPKVEILFILLFLLFLDATPGTYSC